MEIKFIKKSTYDYGNDTLVHEVGDVVSVHPRGEAVVVNAGALQSMRADKAQRWVDRKAATFVKEAGSIEATPGMTPPERAAALESPTKAAKK